MNKSDLIDLIKKLSIERPIFHSEADFQHELALSLKKLGHNVRLEKPYYFSDLNIPLKKVELDIELNGNVAIELKYKTQKLNCEHNAESFRLANHSAANLGRFDFYDDARRVRYFIDRKEFKHGFAVFLTNSPEYWENDGKNTASRNFSMIESRKLQTGDKLSWYPNDPTIGSAGKKRIKPFSPIDILFNSSIEWHEYSKLEDVKFGRFRFVVVEVS